MKDEVPKQPTRPYRFKVRGYTMIIKARNQREAMKQAQRRWGGAAVPIF